MIAPEWTEFPVNDQLDEKTMFCFLIPQEGHRTDVKDTVMSLTPELLLFLRQVRQVDLITQNISGDMDSHTSMERKEDHLFGMSRVTIHQISNHLTQGCNIQTFLVYKVTVPEMPHEQKRENVSETDVLIAFPVCISKYTRV